MDSKKRTQAGDLHRRFQFRADFPDALPERLGQLGQIAVNGRREQLHSRGSGNHCDRVGVERAGMGDSGPPGGVVQVHDVLPPAEGADGKSSTDNFAQGSQVRGNPVGFLGPSLSHPEADDLVEYEQASVVLGEVAEHVQELRVCRHHPHGAQDRLDDYGCQVLPVFLEDPSCRLCFVEGYDDYVALDVVRQSRAGRNGNGIVRVAG